MDDPYTRDLLKSHAYGAGIVIGGSFSGEIVSLRWPSYARLLDSLLPGSSEAIQEAVDVLVGPEVRKQLKSDGPGLRCAP